MIHPIEFRWLVLAEIVGAEYGLRQDIIIKEGTRLSAKIKPYVTESPDGPIEVADLYLEDRSESARFVLPRSSSLTDRNATRIEPLCGSPFTTSRSPCRRSSASSPAVSLKLQLQC